MKKIMMFVAVATMIFAAACSKDNDNKDNGNNGAVIEAAPNTAVIDGRVITIYSHYSIDQNGRGYADAECLEQIDGVTLLSIRADVEENSLNRTFDLTHYYNDADYAFGFGFGGDNQTSMLNYSQDNHTEGVPHYYGVINGEEYNEGAFQSGTLTITRTDDIFDYLLTGKLRNGKAVSFHITVPVDEWEYLDWK